MNEEAGAPELAEEFHESPHYHRVMATDVYGGITPEGSGLSFDLTMTLHPVPKAIFYQPEEIGPGMYQKGPEMRRVPTPGTVVLIERQVGVFVPGPKIRSIANWLQEKADEWEQGPGSR